MRNRLVLSSVFVILFLLLSLTYSADLTKYKKFNELNLNFTNKTIVNNNTSYQIAYLNGTPIFLLSENGSIINDELTIQSVIYNYYKQKYYPSQDELDTVLGLIKSYNQTQSDYKNGNSEINCLRTLFIDGGRSFSGGILKCTPDSGVDPMDDYGCMQAYKLKYYQLSSIGASPPSMTMYIPAIYVLQKAHNSEIKILNTAYDKISNSNESNLYDAVGYLSGKLSDLKSYQRNFQMSPLTSWAWNNGAHRDEEKATFCGKPGNCYVLCAYTLYNTTAYGQMKDTITSMNSNLHDFVAYENLYKTISNQTEARLTYYNDTIQMKHYFDKLDSLFGDMNDTEIRANQSLELIDDTLLQNKLNEMQDEFDTINTSLYMHNFTNISSHINDLERDIKTINSLTDKDNKRYEQIVNNTIKIDAYLYILQSDNFSGDEETQLQNVTSQYYDLVLNRPYTSETAKEMTEKLPKLFDELKDIKKQHDSSIPVQFMKKVRFFARELNAGIVSFGKNFSVKTSVLGTNKSSTLLVGFSVLLFVSTFSLMLLLFMHFLSNMWLKRNITFFRVTTMSMIFMVLVVVLLLGVISMYGELINTTRNIMPYEFINDLKSAPSVSILINDTGDNSGNSLWASDVLSCSGDMQKFIANNSNVDIYELSGNNNCKVYTNITSWEYNSSDKCSKLKKDSNTLLMIINPSSAPGTKIIPNTLLGNDVNIETDKFDAGVCKFEKILNYMMNLN